MTSIGSEKVEISILKSKDRNEEMVKNTVRIHIEEIESKLVYQGLNTYMQARPSEHKFRAPPHIDDLNCFNKEDISFFRWLTETPRTSTFSLFFLNKHKIRSILYR